MNNTHTERQKERQEKKYVVAVRRRRRKKTEQVSDYAILPPSLPPSWKHCVRVLLLCVLIMINAGSTTHTLKPRYWQGSGFGPLLQPVVLCEAVNTLFGL